MSGVNNKLVLDARRYLRINHEFFDGEISDLIAAARADLLLGGILPAKIYDEQDYLIKRAVISYVKAEFGLDNPDAEKYRTCYQNIKQHLMLSTEYLDSEVDDCVLE